MRATIVASAAAWLLTVSAASAQVSATARLEKDRVVTGEPIIVVIDVTNTGKTTVVEGMTCSDDVRLSVVDRQRRQSSPPRLPSPDLVSSVSCGGTTHGPVIEPAGHLEARHILRGYDLGAGTYTLQVEGTLRFREQRGRSAVDAPLSSQLTLTIAPMTTPAELSDALRPLIEAAHGPPSQAKFVAREALIAAAPAFLAEEIAAFAREGSSAAGEALLRIGTQRSHALLREVVATSDPTRYDQTVLIESLEQFGDAADLPIFKAIADDPRTSQWARSAARVAIARLGRDDAVDLLTRGLGSGNAENERDVIRALGYTQSRQAVRALIDRFRGETSMEVCRSLRVLTHRPWCARDGLDIYPDATRRRWLQQWEAEGAAMTIYGAETFAAYEAGEQQRLVATITNPPIVPTPILRPSPRAPRIDKVTPQHPAPNSTVRLDGHNLGFDAPNGSKIIRFRQSGIEHVATPGGSGMMTDKGVAGSEYLLVIAPEGLSPGRCEISIEVSGRTVAATVVEIVTPPPLRLIAVSPAVVHPSDPLVDVTTNHPPPQNARVELIDATGRVWPIDSSASLQGMFFGIPAEAADGVATLRLREPAAGDGDRGVAFTITSAPLPLTPTALRLMRPVAPGQRTRLALDTPDVLELMRIDSAEIEFEQEGRRILVPLEGSRRFVTIPGELMPGRATARSRTSIETTVSAWSAPVSIRLLKRPAPDSVQEIFSEERRVWWEDGPRFVYARRGQAFTISGDLPEQAANVRVQLVRGRETKDVTVADSGDDLQITLPADLTTGDWRLRMGARSSSTAMRDVTLLRVR